MGRQQGSEEPDSPPLPPASTPDWSTGKGFLSVRQSTTQHRVRASSAQSSNEHLSDSPLLARRVLAFDVSPTKAQAPSSDFLRQSLSWRKPWSNRRFFGRPLFVLLFVVAVIAYTCFTVTSRQPVLSVQEAGKAKQGSVVTSSAYQADKINETLQGLDDEGELNEEHGRSIAETNVTIVNESGLREVLKSNEGELLPELAAVSGQVEEKESQTGRREVVDTGRGELGKDDRTMSQNRKEDDTYGGEGASISKPVGKADERASKGETDDDDDDIETEEVGAEVEQDSDSDDKSAAEEVAQGEEGTKLEGQQVKTGQLGASLTSRNAEFAKPEESRGITAGEGSILAGLQLSGKNEGESKGSKIKGDVSETEKTEISFQKPRIRTASNVPTVKVLKEGFSCDRSHWRTDVCTARGDVRFDPRSRTAVLYSKEENTPRGVEKVRPYPFKWGTTIMSLIEEITLISVNAPELKQIDLIDKDIEDAMKTSSDRRVMLDEREKSSLGEWSGSKGAVLDEHELTSEREGMERGRRLLKSVDGVGREVIPAKSAIGGRATNKEWHDSVQLEATVQSKIHNLQEDEKTLNFVEGIDKEQSLRRSQRALLENDIGGKGEDEERTTQRRRKKIKSGDTPTVDEVKRKFKAQQAMKLPHGLSQWGLVWGERRELEMAEKAWKKRKNRKGKLGDQEGARNESSHGGSIGVEIKQEIEREALKEWAHKLVVDTTDEVPNVECDIYHNVTGLVFSIGGYTGNTYHEWHNGIIPLWITAQHLAGEVAFVVVQPVDWWFMKYRHILRAISKYPVVLVGSDPYVHCFPELIVGLRIHDEVTVDAKAMPKGETIWDFQRMLTKALGKKVGKHNPQPEGRYMGCRPVLTYMVREGNRVITNEANLLKIAVELGFVVRISRPIHETLLEDLWHELQTTDLLFGVHGAALTHFLFMRPGAAYIQIVPLGIDYIAHSFLGAPAERLGLQYMEYKIAANESSLSEIYAPDDPVLTNPQAMLDKGESALYLLHQNLTLNEEHMRQLFFKTKLKLRNAHYFIRQTNKAARNPACEEVEGKGTIIELQREFPTPAPAV